MTETLEGDGEETIWMASRDWKVVVAAMGMVVGMEEMVEAVEAMVEATVVAVVKEETVEETMNGELCSHFVPKDRRIPIQLA